MKIIISIPEILTKKIKKIEREKQLFSYEPAILNS